METGQRPRILGAPASTPRRSPRTLPGWRASCAASSILPGKASVAEAITYRANFGEREMMMIWPNWSASFAGDAVARAMGLRARIDADTGWHKTISNVTVTGVTGIDRDVSFDFSGEASDAALLNAAGITTLVRFAGAIATGATAPVRTNRSGPSRAWCAPRRSSATRSSRASPGPATSR
jgi:phage tail sheath protein FI